MTGLALEKEEFCYKGEERNVIKSNWIKRRTYFVSWKMIIACSLAVGMGPTEK